MIYHQLSLWDAAKWRSGFSENPVFKTFWSILCFVPAKLANNRGEVAVPGHAGAGSLADSCSSSPRMCIVALQSAINNQKYL